MNGEIKKNKLPLFVLVIVILVAIFFISLLAQYSGVEPFRVSPLVSQEREVGNEEKEAIIAVALERQEIFLRGDVQEIRGYFLNILTAEEMTAIADLSDDDLLELVRSILEVSGVAEEELRAESTVWSSTSENEIFVSWAVDDEIYSTLRFDKINGLWR